MARKWPNIILFLLFISFGVSICFMCIFTVWSPDLNDITSSNQQFCNEVIYEAKLMKLHRYISELEWQVRNNYSANSQNSKRTLHILPTIYVVTPTYKRPVQKAELTRLTNTLLHVPNLHWIVVEDDKNKSALVENLLLRSGLSFTHLNKATPKNYKITDDDRVRLPSKYQADPQTDISWLKPRGVLQRNAALLWIRTNLIHKESGVIYFADDDNTYDTRLFEEMRHTEKVSVWPVGLVGGLMVEKPILGHDGRVKGWQTTWKPDRPFAIDMAGFAVNLPLLVKHPEARFSLQAKRGYQESLLLSSLVDLEELEVKADKCTKVYVWHTRTQDVKLREEITFIKETSHQSDVGIEV